jgi:hypothetical protein
MTQKQSDVIVGVFQDRAQAGHAYDDLRRAGFGQDYVGIAGQGGDAGDFRKELAKVGVPAEDASYYEQEFNQGRLFVTVRAGGLPTDSIAKAREILERNGGYDANTQRSQAGDNSDLGTNVTTEAPSPYFDLAPGDTRDTRYDKNT